MSLAQGTRRKHSACTYVVELVEHGDGGLPVDAGVGDGDTVLEGGRTFGGHVLSSGVDVGLDHDTGDIAVTGDELLTNAIDDFGLVVVVLLRIAVCSEMRDGKGRKKKKQEKKHPREQSIMMEGWC